MEVRNHRLCNDDGTTVEFQPTSNQGGVLDGGRPRFIVMHYTAGPTSKSAIATFKGAGQARASAHLVIGHDGSITQMVPFNQVAWHAGRSTWRGLTGLNNHSVGIEIVNWGLLEGGPGNWRSYTGALVPDNRVIVAAHRNAPTQRRGWEIYDPPQVGACILAVRAIATVYGIAPIDVIGHDDIAPQRKVDPGPAFDLVRFRAHVFSREDDVDVDADLFVVNASAGLNMRSDAGVGHPKIKTLPHGSQVRVIEKNGLWWLVSERVGGADDTTGWVHSHWLMPA